MPLYVGTSTITVRQRLTMPSAAVSESINDRSGPTSSQSVLTSGTLRLGALQVLPRGQAINTLTVASATQAAVAPTNQWFCLVRQADLSVLVKTVDDLATAWAATALKSLATASTYTPTTDELAYMGVLVVAGTTPSLVVTAGATAAVLALAPSLGGNSTAALTTPASLGATAGAPAASALNFWGYTS